MISVVLRWSAYIHPHGVRYAVLVAVNVVGASGAQVRRESSDRQFWKKTELEVKDE